MGCPLLLCLATLLFMCGVATGQTTYVPITVPSSTPPPPPPGSALFSVGSGAIQLFLSDGEYQTIQLQQPFKYNGKTYTQFNLSMDGYVAFYVPNIDDESPNRNLGKDIIAPLWTDLDAGSWGRWSYEQATSGPLIDQANQEISRTFPYESFSASWVFVATWENVPLELSGFQASLQVVLASDGGDRSIVLMNYGTIPSIDSYYWLAGYCMENSSFVTIPVNNTNELSSTSNVNIPGRWAFEFTVPTSTTPPPGSALFSVGSGAIQLFLSDGEYQTIQLQQPFKYNGKTYTQFYLSMDGYVAFYVPNINDEIPNRNLGKDIIAPLWTDLEAVSGGRWTYEQATSGPLIDQANQEITRTFPYVSFSASWVFVATWENVPLEFSGFQGASLQVVLASDGGDHSFVLMNYGTIPFIDSYYWLAGYCMENSSFITIPVNNTNELSSTSNVNIPGRWAFQFTVPTSTTPPPGSALFSVGSGAIQLFLSDGEYQTIQLQQPFKYNGKTYTQFYLSMDGYVAFYVPNINDEIPNRNLGKDIIAPLWTDLDADSGGRWTYEQATSGPLIDQANQEITRTFPYVSFSASWVFVATWENVPLEFSGFQGASLQVVLASDGGDHSFVLMNYGTIPSIDSYYWLAGYCMENSSFITIPVNNTNELSSTSNVNIPGRWAFQFTVPTSTTPPPGSALFSVGSGAIQLFLSDGEYQTIQLQQPFKYNGKTYTQFYLSMDGYVAFYVPNINDEIPNRNLGKDIIAPLWTDLDADSGGRWTYEQATSGPLIDQANQEITRTFPYVSFSASWVFVATWENVPLEFSGFQGASLQVVLASDGGDHSFVLMNYGTIPSIYSYYWLAGYCMENSSFITIPVNNTYELSSTSNVNIPGRWAFQFTVPTSTTPPPGSALFSVGSGAIQLFLSDGEYQTIQLQQPFKYNGQTYTQFYLSMDGYVAFYVPNINDEIPNRNLGKDIIAPLWTDLDADSGGRWTYEQATSGPLIDQANQEITRTFPYVSFSASWVFVATWENVPLEFSGFQGASLQVVLASDGGDHSFVLMNYGTIPSIYSYYWLAGYCMENSSFITIPVNNTNELSSTSNVNIPGRWAFEFTVPSTTPPPGSALFSVGSGAIQLFLSDGEYQTIQLQQPFKYSGKTYTQFYLSMDGYVAFYVPNINDEIPNRNLGKDIIAPLWTDLDADSGGRWTYEQATSGPLIDQANQEITRTFPYVSFSASWVFVATWENVPLEFSGFQGASLQVVLASDGGDHSFVLMNYGTIPSIYSYYWLAGYCMENSSFITIPVNNTNELSSTSNVNIPGRWAFQFTVPSSTTPPPGSALFSVGSGAIQLFLSDEEYQTIQLQQLFKYNGKTYTQFYLSMNGYVAFYVPNINDEIPNRNLGKDIIAPLWTDLEAVSGGRWTYEQATSGPLIDQANQEITRTFPYVSFSASWVFVATWENVPLEFSGFQGASLQVVLASDGGDHSFVLMNYGTIPSIYSYYWLAGYGMENSSFVTIPVNNANELSSTSNVNIPGRWAFEFTGPCQILNCALDEVCRQINGVYGCACGDNTTSSPNIYDATETCSGSNGSLSLSRCQLFEAGYSADVLHLNDLNCKGEIENNRLVFKFDSYANTCGTTLENNATHIIFKNNVLSSNRRGIISRTGGINIAFSCVYPIIQSISMPTDIEAIGGITSQHLSTGGTYQIRMTPYTDATFLVPYSGNVTLEVNHQMYIAVEVDQFDNTQIALVLDNCWATPVNQIDYSVRWDLIINECPNLNDGTVAVLQNGVSTSSHFSFRMFTFTGFSSKIYLHCQVQLCTTNCAMSCPLQLSRRRRSVDFYDSAAITMKF
ncbi:uncharacterized protein LOC113662188 isoform X2 [Tachysurus fulvidraco]|uniref:uncharacterized protein LOC113662188 isoform X2 n=1 Tax=Tachysurus fulvidraco TaxID=1234273 RepID=UPI001FEEEBCC|nr:uncharacterized protein LOC113662188 isoform X2 [Tachysurus fulvidraco]